MEGHKQAIPEQQLVRNCLLEIVRRNGYEYDSQLSHRDYEYISQEIETKTSTLISVSTLKRLLHGEFSRIPQTGTLNAISRYLGFKNWQDYKQSTTAPLSVDSVSQNSGVEIPATNKKRSSFLRRIGLISLTSFTGICVAIVLLFIQYSSRQAVRNVDTASFSAEKTTSNEIPNTVLFHYNVDDVVADSFFIQQSWDQNRRVRVYKNNYTLTDIYYEPGYHIAKLIANDSVIKTVNVSIPTDRWFLFAKDLSPTAVPQYVKQSTPIFHSGVLKLNPNDLAENKIDIREEKAFVYTYFPTDLKVNSDNFVLKTRVRIEEVKNNVCPSLMIEVTAQQAFMFFKTGLKGCASESMALFGENFMDGKHADLSSLGYDVTNWMDIEWRIQNKKVTILFDGKLVFNTTYKTSVGLISGIVFASNGLPEIDYVDVRAIDGTVVYQNDFSNGVASSDRQ